MKTHKNILVSVLNIVIFLFPLFLSCSNNSNNNKYIHESLNQVGKKLIRKVNIDTGGISSIIKYYSLDTFPDGPEIHYDLKGKITKWLWYTKGEKYIIYGIYYDGNGKFKTQKGEPFLSAINYDSALAIQTVNPPGVNYLVGYRDFENGKIMNKILKEPGKTDSTSWITVPGHQFKKGHIYMVYFYIADSTGKLIDSLYQELAP